MKTKIFLVVIMIFVLTGCSNKEPTNVEVVLPSVTISFPTNITTSTPTLEPTATPEPTETMTPTITITTSPTPEPTKFGGGVGIFSNVTTGNTIANLKKFGIYKIDLLEKSYQQITGPEYQMVGVSPDYMKILVLNSLNTDISELSVIDVSDGSISKLASNVFGRFGKSAYWYDNDLIAFIGWEQGSKFIYTIQLDGSGLKKLSDNNFRPLLLNPSSAETGVCFCGGSFNGSRLNLQDNWCLPFDESNPINMEFSGSAAFSPKPGFLAYSRYNESDVVIISPDLTTYYKGPGTYITDDISLTPISWSPDGSKLLILIGYSIIDRTIIEYVVVSPKGLLIDIPTYDGLGSGPIAWSPDGTQLLINDYLYNISTKEVTLLEEFLPEGWNLGHAIWGDRSP